MKAYLESERDRVEVVQQFAATDEQGQIYRLELWQTWHSFIYLGEVHEVPGPREYRTDRGDLVIRQAQGHYTIYRNGPGPAELVVISADGP